MNDHDKQLADQIKWLFKKKEYERLLYLCRSIPKDNINYGLAQRYSQKARFMLSNGDVKWAVAFVCVAMTILLSGIIYVNKKVDREFRLKELQVNSLIDELGIVREENSSLNHQIDEKDAYVNLALSSLTTLDDRISKIQEGEQAKSIRAEIEATKQSLASKKTSNAPAAKQGVDEAYEGRHIKAFLLLGTHGRLTDTIMVAVANRESQTITLMSIPRDLFIQGRKINAIHSSYGAHKLMEYLTEVTGLPITNYAVINLQGFIEMVDIFGGLTVVNEKGIHDTLYPGPNHTYTTFSLAEGEHNLDGQTALKYARSRKSTSDFDRAKRQQQIIKAFIDKTKSYDFVANIERFQEVYDILSKNIDTNIELSEGMGWMNEFKSFEIQRGNTLDTTNFLYPTRNVQGQYILLPNKSDYSEIRSFVKEIVIK